MQPVDDHPNARASEPRRARPSRPAPTLVARVRAVVSAARVALLGAPPKKLAPKQGAWLAGEVAAVQVLVGKGCKVLGRNVVVPMGEADVVCEAPGHWFVIVEVKSRVRRSDAPAKSNAVAPEASVTQEKQRKLRAIARYLAKLNRWPLSRVRIDVIAVELEAGGGAHQEPGRGGLRVREIRHHENAVPLHGARSRT